MKLHIYIHKPTRNSVDYERYICIIGLRQNLDAHNIDEFEYLFTALLKGGLRRVILDVEELNFIDSAGLGKLIQFTKGLRKLGGEMIVTRYSAKMIGLARSINLDQFIRFYPTNEEGIDHFNTR